MTTVTAKVFRLPDLGEGLTEAALVQWVVKVGDTITTDQVIAEVETAKSVVELPSPFAGVITALHGEAGDIIAVGAPVLEVEERAGSGNVLIGYGTTERPHSGRRRSRASSTPASPAPVISTVSSSRPRTVAVRSPLVRRLARDLGVDVRSIEATGADGAVTRADVLRAANALEDAQPQASGASGESIDGLAVASRDRLSPMRRAIGATLSRSRAEIPEATVWVDVDATELWEARSRMAPEGGKAPSITALVARFTLMALEDHPVLASRLSDDASEIVSFDGVNLGVATDTERGLLVPVIRRAHALTIDDLDTQLRELADTAREGRMPAERLRGSTFTLNNYGGLGVDGSAAIINHPEVAILGVGRMIERPWVVDGQIAVRRIAQLSLVFDHRVCDGGYAAGFLRRLVELIEHPLRAFGRI